MKKLSDAYMEILQGPIQVFVLIVLLMLLSQVFGSNKSVRQTKSKKVYLPEAQKEQMARRIALDFSVGKFKPSLEMKENVDFLLTPALLMQEALSDDIVITYPME